ncbi:MAG: DUF2993 domain-containing protein [Cyanobacteria bacterium J06607_15]
MPQKWGVGSKLIGKLLSGAVKLYLRSQVERVENLQVKIGGKSKQILQGYIPEVWLSCDRAIYQGLHLNQIQLNGTNIAVNLPEVIKKQPLKLIEPIFIDIALKLNTVDLQASLASDLLQSGLADLWRMILAAQDSTELDRGTIAWQKIAIVNESLVLLGRYQDASGETKKLTLTTEINLKDDHCLCLAPLKIASDSLQNGTLERQLEIDLGTDVAIANLTMESGQILCTGKIRVNN